MVDHEIVDNNLFVISVNLMKDDDIQRRKFLVIIKLRKHLVHQRLIES